MFAATSRYRNDGDAGLMLVGARYYDATVGRFISRDSLLDQRPYVYCAGDPVNALDPSGHIPGWVNFVKLVIELAMNLASGVKGDVVGGPAEGTRPFDPVVTPTPISAPPPPGWSPEGPPPPFPVSFPEEPNAGGEVAGAIGTVGTGIGVGAVAIHYGIGWARAAGSYLDPDGKWSLSGGF